MARQLLLATCALLTANCAELGCPPAGGTHVRMDFTRNGDFRSAPFPSAELADPITGAYDLSAFPNRHRVSLLEPAFDLIEEETDGVGLSSAISFALTAASTSRSCRISAPALRAAPWWR